MQIIHPSHNCTYVHVKNSDAFVCASSHNNICFQHVKESKSGQLGMNSHANLDYSTASWLKNTLHFDRVGLGEKPEHIVPKDPKYPDKKVRNKPRWLQNQNDVGATIFQLSIHLMRTVQYNICWYSPMSGLIEDRKHWKLVANVACTINVESQVNLIPNYDKLTSMVTIASF